jgi:hypothetical protein
MLSPRGHFRFFQMLSVLCLVGLQQFFIPTAFGQAAADLSGSYKSGDSELSILFGTGTLIFSYETVFGVNAHTCSCLGRAESKDGKEYLVVADDSVKAIKLIVTAKRISLSRTGDGEPECCGMGWGGDEFSLTDRTMPSSCKVAAQRANFYDVYGSNVAQKAYVIAGDTVECVQNIGGDKAFFLGRFVGKKIFHGLMKAGDLKCPEQAPAAAAPAKAK